MKSLLRALPLFLFIAGLAPAAEAAVSKTSKRIIRQAAPPLNVVPNFTATALSTTSIQWGWSTGSFTGSGITGFHLYSSSTPTVIDFSLASGTSYYIDAGLGANKQFTRWITSYDGTGQGSDSDHIAKYTYATPPFTLTLSTLTAESVYVTWHFSSATAYAVLCSTNGGTDWVRNRDVFVPWQTIDLLSNKSYLIRLGGVNGDNELTPGLYSVTKTTVTPPLDLTMTGVAVSSYTIEWNWSTGTLFATGITGYNIYHSTTTGDASIPPDNYEGAPVSPLLGAGATYWIESFVDGGSTTTVAANSLHTRWIKAVGSYLVDGSSLVSLGKTNFQRYTYAIAPATTTVIWLDPSPYWTAHVGENYASLIWAPRVSVSEASKYIVDYSTVAGFAVAVSSKMTTGNPFTVDGLADNTKYDLRLGAFNGDNLQTPDNAANPFAYSQAYKVMTRPVPPAGFACNAFTDTALKCTWSTSTYVNANYITGYSVGDLHHRTNNGVDEIYWDPLDLLPGVASHEYSLDYLLTNSTHTLSVWVSQTDPAWVAGNPHYDAFPQELEFWYANFGSYRLDKDGYTYATPPNDVSFYSIRSSTIGLTWNEPIIPATKYRVERSTTLGESGPWVFLSSVTGNTYEDTGLTPYTTYSYRIGAINLLGFQTIGMSTATDGNRRDYSFVSSTLTKHISPTMVGTATSTNTINWSWTNTVPGVLSYNLYTSSDGVVVAGLGAGATFYVEVNLSSANARYTRRVRSYTSFGEGDYSQAAISTLANPPAAPVLTSSGVHTMALEWLDSDGSTRYSLDRSTDKNSWTPVKAWSDVFISTWLRDTGLRFATTYYYAVGGYNQDGILSISSSISSANMTLPLPAAYTAVFATAAASQNITAPLTGVGLVSVAVPAGAPDGYFFISTNAFTSPVDVTKADLDAATAKLTSVSLLTGSIVELHLYDIYGSSVSSNLPSAARINMIYTDANNDDIVDGTSAQAVSLRIFSLDTSALVWNQIANSMLNNPANTVYADIPHFSFYALGSITSAAGTISDVFAYPNPYKPGSSGSFGQSVYGDGVVFESLPARSSVKIYNLAGGLVRELNDDDGDGRCLWNARNTDGARAASGTYLYLVTSPAGTKKSGRIAIIK
ncbi:MAG: fibronectin type III domain-containing protein [Elusimicrobiales bacterium]|nr:fibronectin type III domain-containing protein [Elusimicrobiales bacterium]